MPFKVQIDTNIDFKSKDIEDLQNSIKVLQTTFNQAQEVLYHHFLGRRSLTFALVLSLSCLLLYAISHAMFFVYAALISAAIIFIGSLLIASLVTSMIRRQLNARIELIKKRIEVLKRKQEYNN